MSFKDRLGNVAKQAQESSKAYGSKVSEATSSGAEHTKNAAAARRYSTLNSLGEITKLYDDGNLSELFARVELPPYPVVEPWHWSLGQVITAGEKPPRGIATLLKQLDHFGRIDISPDRIGFDGRNAKWDKVTSVRTRSFEDILSQFLTAGTVDSLRGALPPVPGRKWVLQKAAGALFTIWALAADRALSAPGIEEMRVVCEIEYKGWIRTKEAETGTFTGAVMALLPDLDQTVRREVERRGIPIEAAETDSALSRAGDRAEWLREKKAAILSRRDSEIAQIEAEDAEGREESSS